MKSDSIRNVVFDLGGVLIAWNPDEIIGGVFDAPELRALIKREIFQHADWLEMDRGQLTEADAIPRFYDRTGVPIAKLEELLQHAMESLIPIPESLDLLNELAAQGVNLYCLSNMPAWRFDYIQPRYPFWSHFRGIVISGVVKMIKPDREIFEHLLTQFQLEASTTVFVDDHPINLDGARQLGLHTILFRSADDCRRQLQLKLMEPQS
jgi:putative hydrolase of the HAD superfamily